MFFKDASKFFAEADQKAEIKLDKADQDLVSLFSEEKVVTDEVRKLSKNDSKYFQI